jgi:predicted secreted Zn-dependent protease
MHDATYAISGDTATALVAEMGAQNLLDEAGDAVFALTTWNVVWTYDWVTGPGPSCGIGDLAVSVAIETTLPTWKPPPTAAAHLVDSWERYTEALVIHERGHVQNGLNRAAEIVAAMASIDHKPTCDALESSADAAGAAIIDEGRTWDVTYDADTIHGATQGASFP